MSANKLTALALLSLLAATTAASGQGLGNSPYSRLGLGDYNPNTGGIRQQGIGGVGLAAPNAVQVNDLNPALVYYLNRTTYEAAFTGQLKDISSRTAKQRTGGGTLGYLSFAVPLSRRWAASASLRPLTAVEYESRQLSTVPGNTQARALTQYIGSGGLSEVAVSQGVRVAKGLSLGLTTSYVFGTIDRTTAAIVNPFPDSTLDTEILRRVALIEQTEYSDFLFRAGAHYRRAVNSKLNLNLGGVYTFESKLDGTRARQQDEQDPNGTSLLNTPIELERQQGSTVLPAMWQAGIGLDNNRNWSLNADVARQRWSKFREFNSPDPSFADTWRVGLGGEFTPDPSSVSSYFQRVSYRAGVSLTQLPYSPGGQQLTDRAVSWGFSLPFPTASALDATTLNLAFTYGQRGNTDVVGSDQRSNVRESYMRIQAGVSLNSRWFLKRRVE